MKTATTNNRLKKLVSFGNSKLPKHTAIFNLGSAFDCPSDKLGLCQCSKECYAKKAERMYPQPGPYRTRQLQYWNDVDYMEFLNDFTDILKRKRNKVRYLRFNESGDFYSQSDIDKMELIAHYLYKFYDIKTYVYTARRDLDYRNTYYLRIMFSNTVPDKKPEKYGVFKAIAKTDNVPDGFGVCPGDCTECVRCVHGLNTVVYLH